MRVRRRQWFMLMLLLGSILLLYLAWEREDQSAPKCMVSSPSVGETKPPEQDGAIPPPQLDFIYTWDLHHSPTHTVLTGDLEPDAFSLLEKALWPIHIQTFGSGYSLQGDEITWHARHALNRVITRTSITHQGSWVRRMPSGRLHQQHLAILSCQVEVHPLLFGKPIVTEAQQTLLIDGMDGCIDLVPMKKQAAGKPRLSIISTIPSGLPERYAGTATEREMQRILDTLACIRTTALAKDCVPWLLLHTRELVTSQENPTASWPHCWGAAADMAQRLSYRVIPTLIYLQENNCFGSQELADYINSPLFSKLFGEDFTPDDHTNGSSDPSGSLST